MKRTYSKLAASADRSEPDGAEAPAPEQERRLFEEYENAFGMPGTAEVANVSSKDQVMNVRLVGRPYVIYEERASSAENYRDLREQLKKAIENSANEQEYSARLIVYSKSRPFTAHDLLLALLSATDSSKDNSLRKLLAQLLGKSDDSKGKEQDTQKNQDHLRFTLKHDVRQSMRWEDFVPLSYYFTCDGRFVIHVEGHTLNSISLRQLEALAGAYLRAHFRSFRCEIITAGLGAIACSSPEEENTMTIASGRFRQSQLVGLHLQCDSVIYWASTAHGLEKVLAFDRSRISDPSVSADPLRCTRCLPPGVSLSIGGQSTLAYVSKRFKYFGVFRQPAPGLTPSVDIMLGPAPVLASDVTGVLGNERIARMSVAGHLRPRGSPPVEYHVTGVCGYSEARLVHGSSPPQFVYSTLIPGAPMTEGRVVTVPGDGGQVKIMGLPSDAYGSGLLCIEPSRNGEHVRGHSGYTEPALGHSGGVWYVLDNSSGQPSCRAFAITVAIADNFNGTGGRVWLVSDLNVSLTDIVSGYPNHFNDDRRNFRCITRGAVNGSEHTTSLRPETL